MSHISIRWRPFAGRIGVQPTEAIETERAWRFSGIDVKRTRVWVDTQTRAIKTKESFMESDQEKTNTKFSRLLQLFFMDGRELYYELLLMRSLLFIRCYCCWY